MKNSEPTGNKFSERSTEELIIQQKQRYVILIFFSIILGIMIVASRYAAITKEVSATTFIPLSFLPVYLVFWKVHNNLCNEIKSRKSN